MNTPVLMQLDYEGVDMLSNGHTTVLFDTFTLWDGSDADEASYCGYVEYCRN